MYSKYDIYIIVPSSPAEVKAMTLTSEAIIVSWRPPTHPNGRITHYTVYVKAVTK